MDSIRILIAGEPRDFLHALQRYLAAEGFMAEIADDGREALRRLGAYPPALLIVEPAVPGLDGWEVCRRTRRKSEVPIIVLASGCREADMLRAFALGADDCVTVPISHRELLARVRAVLRRSAQPPSASDASELRLGGLRLDVQRHEVWVGDRPVRLRLKEFQLLAALLERPGMVLSYGTLLQRVWGEELYGDRHSLGVHISWLRRQIAGSGVGIEAVRGVGYKLVPSTAGTPQQI